MRFLVLIAFFFMSFAWAAPARSPQHGQGVYTPWVAEHAGSGSTAKSPLS